VKRKKKVKASPKPIREGLLSGSMLPLSMEQRALQVAMARQLREKNDPLNQPTRLPPGVEGELIIVNSPRLRRMREMGVPFAEIPAETLRNGMLEAGLNLIPQAHQGMKMTGGLTKGRTTARDQDKARRERFKDKIHSRLDGGEKPSAIAKDYEQKIDEAKKKAKELGLNQKKKKELINDAGISRSIVYEIARKYRPPQ
jgi:hypothetical protein